MAAYHYFRIFNSWNAAYEVIDGVVQTTGQPFNEAYRYMDWIVTVPLLIAEPVIVLGLPRERRRSVLLRLVPAAALMILLGYPGELTSRGRAEGHLGHPVDHPLRLHPVGSVR